MRRQHLLLAAIVCVALAPAVVCAQTVALVAGGGHGGGVIPATQAELLKPFAVAFDKAGNLYIGEFDGCRVRKVDPQGMLSTIAGDGQERFAGDGGPARLGSVNLIHDVIVGPDQNLYVADSSNLRVRKIDLKSGLLSTFAGAGEKKISGDGYLASHANLDGVASLCFDPTGRTMYLAGFSKVVRAIDMKSSEIRTVPGLPGGRSIAVDSKGNLFVAGGQTLRVRAPSGQTRTLLDSTHAGGSTLPLGDNPKHLAIDADDNVILCDEHNNLIRKYVVAEGKLLTIAGNGQAGAKGVGGPPDQLQLRRPHGICFNPADGLLYIADSFNDRILRITP